MAYASDTGRAWTNDAIQSLRCRLPTERTIDETLTAKLRARPGGPYRSRSLAEIHACLDGFLRKRIDGDFRISELAPLSGGSSKEQFVLRLEARDGLGKRRDEKLVLRMRPAESIVETHPEREWQALCAVGNEIPVPEPCWKDPDGSELGQPSIIYRYVGGIAKPPAEGAHVPRGSFGAKYRELLAPQFVGYFAALATLDFSKSDMSAFDAPDAGSNAGVIQAVNWWQRVWEEDCRTREPMITLASQWLRENAPPIDHVSLVHQDFRGGNFLFDPDDGRITAFLDWEMVMLGDRHLDLAFFMSEMFVDRDETTGEPLLGGLIAEERFLEQYQRITGLPVDLNRLHYYTVFACWRSAIIDLATAPCIASGGKTHQDVRVAWIASTAPIVARGLHRALAGELA